MQADFGPPVSFSFTHRRVTVLVTGLVGKSIILAGDSGRYAKEFYGKKATIYTVYMTGNDTNYVRRYDVVTEDGLVIEGLAANDFYLTCP